MKTGWLKDGPDGRDYKYSSIRMIAKIDDTVDLRKRMPEVNDQGLMSSCVGRALTNGIEFLRERKKRLVELSALFAYYNARAIDHLEHDDNGCVIRSAIKAVCINGICLEKKWPYKRTNVCITPNEKAYKDAKTELITDYFRIEKGDITGIQAALTEGYPVIFGAILFKSFQMTDSEGIVKMPTFVDDNYLGGHCMLICGYTNKYFIVQNSWGKKWGAKGYCYMPFEYFSYAKNLTDDFWVIRH